MAVCLLEGPFTVEDYHRLAETGVLHEDDRVELICGRVIQMTPIGRRQAGCVNYLTNTLAALLGQQAVVSVQNPVILDPHVEPQPDLAVLKPRPGYYRDAHPVPADVLLIIEVADTSLDYDRDEKLPLYAQAGIPEVWLVSLPGDGTEIYRHLRDAHYTNVRTARRGETLTPLALPGITLRVNEILG